MTDLSSTPVHTEVLDMDGLNATDRCDRCSAQAFVVTGHGRLILMWCAHHFAQHEVELLDHVLHDQRGAINTAPSVSAY